MSKKWTIFLDMDGVCCNFIDATFKLMGKEELVGTWPKKAKNLEDIFGISPKEYWKKIDKHESKFWRELEEYEWFKEMYDELSKLGKVVFLTCPSWSPECVKGKLQWLYDRFGEGFREYIFTKRKFYVAKENAILIDDYEKHCRHFEENGGRAVLFPQKWNSDREVEDGIKYVLDQVKKIVGEKPICKNCEYLVLHKDALMSPKVSCTAENKGKIDPVTGEAETTNNENPWVKNDNFSCTQFKRKFKEEDNIKKWFKEIWEKIKKW